MAQYRLADEMGGGGQISSAKKAAWNPTALFFLVWLCAIFGSVAGPLVSLFAVWNWKRLGQPKKFQQSLVFLFLVLITPFVLGMLGLQTGFPDPILRRSLSFGACLVFAYWFLLGQKELYQTHLQNGGKAAAMLMPIATGVLLVAALWAWVFWNRSFA